MEHHAMMMSGAGNLIVIALTGAVTIACFVALLWMLVRPGERDPRHPKYRVLRDDH